VSQEKHDESFRVVDRRLFTADGELRKEAVEQKSRDNEARQAGLLKAQETEAANAGTPKPQLTPVRDSVDGMPAASGNEGQEVAAKPAPSHGFQMLVDVIAQNGAAVMGGMTDPRTGQPFVDLAAAREFIEMLDALRDASRGNIAAEDEQLLQQVASSLKFTFAEISAAASEALRAKAQVKP
jgi:hypothetical protein